MVLVSDSDLSDLKWKKSVGKDDDSKSKLATTPMTSGRLKVKSRSGWEVKLPLVPASSDRIGTS